MLSGSSTVAFGYANGTSSAFLLRIFQGLGSGAAVVGSFSMISEEFSSHVGQVLAIQEFVVAAAFVTAPPLGSYLYETQGRAHTHLRDLPRGDKLRHVVVRLHRPLPGHASAQGLGRRARGGWSWFRVERVRLLPRRTRVCVAQSQLRLQAGDLAGAAAAGCRLHLPRPAAVPERPLPEHQESVARPVRLADADGVWHRAGHCAWPPADTGERSRQGHARVQPCDRTVRRCHLPGPGAGTIHGVRAHADLADDALDQLHQLAGQPGELHRHVRLVPAVGLRRVLGADARPRRLRGGALAHERGHRRAPAAEEETRAAHAAAVRVRPVRVLRRRRRHRRVRRLLGQHVTRQATYHHLTTGFCTPFTRK
ncbi:hypothetical protein ON010_g18643 [Phytophthora cinnamomi]|nr:hypothetical protein ON010_g18643 [Phytophthora cinnamomi]